MVSLQQLALTLTFVLNQSFFFLIPFTRMVSAKKSVKITTNRTTYYVGENITLHCEAVSRFLNETIFTYGDGIKVSKEYVTVINDTYARMDRPVLDEDLARSTFYCWLDYANINLGYASQTVSTEYRPRNVTDIACVYQQRQDVHCTWNLDVKYKHSRITKVIARWTTDPKNASWWMNCTNSTTTSCTIQGYCNLFLALRVNVSHKGWPETASLQFDIADVNDHVRSNPVSELTVSSVNATCASLVWTMPLTGLVFTVSYGRKDLQDGFRKITTVAENITICGLHPFCNYTFAVTAKPSRRGGYASEPTTLDLQTEEDVPSSGPRIIKGGYFRKPCTTNQVFIYIQPIKEEDRNGIVTSYSAVVSVDGESQTNSYTLPENQFVFIITAPCNRGITAALYANTSVGRSPAAVLSVPALNVELQAKQEEMDLRIKETGQRSFLATWDPPSDHQSYTLFLYHCKESSPPKVCKGPMKSILVNISNGSQMLDISEADLFGLSLIRANNITSGMHFTECVFNPKGGEIATPKKPLFDANVKTIRWTYPRCNRDRKVMTIGYIIKVCVEEHLLNCTWYLVNSGSQLHYDLGNLSTGILYNATITANTTSGLSAESEAVSFMLSLMEEDDKGEIMEVINPILLLALFVPFVLFAGIVLACILRKMYRKSLRKLESVHFPARASVATDNIDINGNWPTSTIPKRTESGYESSLSDSRFPMHDSEMFEEWTKSIHTHFNGTKYSFDPSYPLDASFEPQEASLPTPISPRREVTFNRPAVGEGSKSSDSLKCGRGDLSCQVGFGNSYPVNERDLISTRPSVQTSQFINMDHPCNASYVKLQTLPTDLFRVPPPPACHSAHTQPYKQDDHGRGENGDDDEEVEGERDGDGDGDNYDSADDVNAFVDTHEEADDKSQQITSYVFTTSISSDTQATRMSWHQNPMSDLPSKISILKTSAKDLSAMKNDSTPLLDKNSIINLT